ncbi:MAG: ATP-binding protein, partial [Verrucomicrobiales bacterium]|nr:ATP-binding protein [Verrucomicrobiales bacterium]
MKANSLSANETLKLLEDLTTGVEAFAAREKGFERAVQLRDSSLRQNVADEKAAIKEATSGKIEKLKESANARKEEITAVTRERELTIDKAQITVRNQVIGGIQQTQGKRKAQAQKAYMDAGKRRESDLGEAGFTYQARSTESTELSNSLVKIEKGMVKSLRGFRSLQRQLIEELKGAVRDDVVEADSVALSEKRNQLASRFKAFRGQPLVGLVNGFPLVMQIFLVLLMGGIMPLLMSTVGGPEVTYIASLGGAVGVVIVLLLFFVIARGQAASFLGEISPLAVSAKKERLALKESVEQDYQDRVAEIEKKFREAKAAFDKELQSDGEGSGTKYDGPDAVEERANRLKEAAGKHRDRRLELIDAAVAARVAEIEKARDEKIALVEQGGGGQGQDLEAQFSGIISQWEEKVVPAHQTLVSETDRKNAQGAVLSGNPDDWNPPATFEEILPIGQLSYSGATAELELPEADQLDLGQAPDYEVLLQSRVPDAASVLVETKQFGREEAIGFLNYLSLGWLAGSPPGRLSFSFIDPVGLGESFAGLMHLADYEELLINSRIRTREDQIEERLGELCEHMEKVIQMYLRQDFDSITDYNEKAGTIAERYHFLVVADFPKGFSDVAAKRLQSIAASGARCGVFLLMHCDQRGTLPPGFQMDDLRKACLCLRSNIDGFFLKENPVSGTTLSLNEPPPADVFAKWVHRIGEANRDSNRIEVPFSQIAPAESEMWSSDTAKELTVPIGRTGATKLQELALGKGTCQHALIAGKTGSGKSTLFHVIVTNLTLWCDPDEVEFYLIDFKKGVEFKCYADARVPHARVIAIESDREFGLSVLKRLDEELKHRGELFRAASVQDVPGYRATPNAEPMPRTLLLIDEFQEFFVEDDQISQQAAVLLDRIVRQGRAFGIHAILGSQTLGGAFTLARATLGQMTVRIALACNEADAYLIMDDSNPAPRLLTRPGEGIYNDRAGAIEANSPFQVVWMDESERDTYLESVHRRGLASGKTGRGQVVFEGNAPGDVTRDEYVSEFLGDPKGAPRLFLGAPNAIKGPTEVSFERQSGSNLMIVGQREDAVDSLVAIGLRTLRKQLGEQVRLVLLDHRFSQDGEPDWFVDAVKAVPGVECPSMTDVAGVLGDLTTQMKAAESGEASAKNTTFLFIPSLHRYKKLRYEEDFSFSMDESAEAKPSDSLHELICEGASWGFHVVCSLDSYNSVNRSLGRKAAGE